MIGELFVWLFVYFNQYLQELAIMIISHCSRCGYFTNCRNLKYVLFRFLWYGYVLPDMFPLQEIKWAYVSCQRDCFFLNRWEQLSIAKYFSSDEVFWLVFGYMLVLVRISIYSVMQFPTKTHEIWLYRQNDIQWASRHLSSPASSVFL